MTISALRIIAGAGVLAAGLLIVGPAVVPVLAQTGDATDSGGGSDGDSPPSFGTESAPAIDGGGSSATDGSGHPTSTIGNGRNDVVDPTGTGDGGGVRVGETRPSPKFDPLLVPFTALNDILRALSQPKPKPMPAPAFRMQQEAPVIDAAPDPGGGGSESMAAVSDGPKAFEVPLVSAPRMPVPPELRRLPAPAAAGREPAAASAPSVVGARTPVLRGSLPASGESATVSRSLTSGASGQPAQVSYPRYLRTPTAAELSMVALPGVAGLIVLTLSGGVIGYRQANSARFIRTSAAARFMP